jgi:hypothetical protein
MPVQKAFNFYMLWFHFHLLFALFLVWLFRVLVFRVLRLWFLPVLFCPLFQGLAVRSGLAVLRVLIALSARLFRLLRCSLFLRFWLAVGLPVLRLRCVRLRWFIGLPVVAVCSWRFLLALRLWVLLRPCRFVALVRVRGVRWRWLLGWVFRFSWSCLPAFVPLAVLFLLLLPCRLAFRAWALRLVAVRCGWRFSGFGSLLLALLLGRSVLVLFGRLNGLLKLFKSFLYARLKARFKFKIHYCPLIQNPFFRPFLIRPF